eukprot:9745516-Prorocentrum_lima.AAC.1
MTSSLVGSEMCIRDRFGVVWAQSNTPMDPLGGGHPGLKMVDVRKQEEAVSYTHLTLPTICSV